MRKANGQAYHTQMRVQLSALITQSLMLHTQALASSLPMTLPLFLQRPCCMHSKQHLLLPGPEACLALLEIISYLWPQTGCVCPATRPPCPSGWCHQGQWSAQSCSSQLAWGDEKFGGEVRPETADMKGGGGGCKLQWQWQGCALRFASEHTHGPSMHNPKLFSKTPRCPYPVTVFLSCFDSAQLKLGSSYCLLHNSNNYLNMRPQT